jgi:predicted NAD-dependent protein-ADP-ribosyltransferase YbiA (DUF1768 family)
MSDDEDEDIRSVLTGKYRQYRQGEEVVQFKANFRKPACYLSNFAVVDSGVTYEGITYPSVEHAYQAQKFSPESRKMFSKTGIYGNPTDNFHQGWVAYFTAKTPNGKNIMGEVEKKKRSDYAIDKNRTMGVLAKMVNTLSRKETKRERKIDVLHLRSTPFNFQDAHEKLWLELLRSKYEDPMMREALMGTGDAYLIEFQLKKDKIDFYTAYYDKSAKNCAHCNEPACNSMGKLLMKIRDEIRGIHAARPAASPSAASSSLAENKINDHSMNARAQHFTGTSKYGRVGTSRSPHHEAVSRFSRRLPTRRVRSPKRSRIGQFYTTTSKYGRKAERNPNLSYPRYESPVFSPSPVSPPLSPRSVRNRGRALMANRRAMTRFGRRVAQPVIEVYDSPDVIEISDSDDSDEGEPELHHRFNGR